MYRPGGGRDTPGMGTPTTTVRTSGIPRQGPVDHRRLQRRRTSLETTAAATVAAVAAVLLALVLRPDLTDVALAMLLVGTTLALVAAPVRVLLAARSARGR